MPVSATQLAGSVLRAVSAYTTRSKSVVRREWRRCCLPTPSRRRFSGSAARGDGARVPLQWLDVGGLVGYDSALTWQRRVHDLVRRGVAPDTCLCLEHEPVYTLGRAASDAHLKFVPGERGAPHVQRVERGGEVTYHGPGQVVVYFMFDLSRHKRDLHWYVHSVEEVAIRTLAEFNLAASREPGLPGVWVGGAKVAAVGISVSRWVTMHGISINVCPRMADFERIVPCGIADRPVTSMAELLADTAEAAPVGATAAVGRVDAVRTAVQRAVLSVFGMVPCASSEVARPLGAGPLEQHAEQAPWTRVPRWWTPEDVGALLDHYDGANGS